MVTPAPLNLKLNASHEGRIAVNWSLSTSPDRIPSRVNQVQGFLLQCESDDTLISRSLQVNSTVTRAFFDNLSVNASYKVEIWYMTELGTGVSSVEVVSFPGMFAFSPICT